MRTVFDTITHSQTVNLIMRIQGIQTSMAKITPQFAEETDEAMHVLWYTISHHQDPLEAFDLINTGCYKACFDLCQGWVVKFAQWESDLEDERATYEAALNTGLGDLFAPTFYIHMPGIGIPCNVMVEHGNWCDERWDDEKEGYVEGDDTLYFDTVIIQRRVDYLLCDIDDRFEAKYTCDKEKVYNAELSFAPGEERPAKWFIVDRGSYMSDEYLIKNEYNRPGCVDMDYIIEDQHGPEFFKKYAEFYEYWNMSDLHSYNMGFMQVDDNPYHDKLIIIDWLSYSPETACTRTEM